ncbi:RRQRL motif-containing zinc-binding protein [Nonomuraea fuscirosea]|uniref:RRQRL motif-containing zinc-binding protein n=1 Tax=Nonomuraea fuscirosea TaxID=1291556 RepID=UPI0033E6FD80
MSRIRAAFWDPTGSRYSIPTFPWRMAPPHLLTLRQLTAEGLRPGGQDVQAQILWRSRRHGASGVRASYLYDIRLALPKRPMTPAKWTALAKANAARRRCPSCGLDAGFVLSRYADTCTTCHHQRADARTETAA